MRRDPLRMYVVKSILCPLVAIRYLMSPVNGASNSQNQRFKAMKQTHLGWSTHIIVVEEEKADKEHFLKMSQGNNQRQYLERWTTCALDDKQIYTDAKSKDAKEQEEKRS
ncbi:hypothetical protein BD560DRAFT_428008 [Blakeslea trispora]|nr:hypothetical protein BD560DRAFT_428008 [Blakeslea trispora]